MRFDEKAITINHHNYLLSGYDVSDYYQVDIIPDYDMFEDGMACNGVAFCYDMGDTIDVHYKVSITPKGKNKSKVVLDEDEIIDKEDFGYVNDSVFVMICEWIDNRYGKELFESKKITKRSLKESKDEYDIKYDLVINALRLCWKADLILEDTYKRYKNKSVKIKNIDDAYDFAYTILYGKENDMLKAFHELMNLLHIEDFERHFDL